MKNHYYSLSFIFAFVILISSILIFPSQWGIAGADVSNIGEELPDFALKGKTVKIDINNIVSDNSVLPLQIDSAYGLSVDAKINFRTDTGLVRFILEDGENEYLIFESYPSLHGKSTIVINNGCEETCALNSISNPILKIDVIDAAVDIKSVNYIDNPIKLDTKSEVKTYNQKLKNKQDSYKINKLKQQSLTWIPSITSVSKLSYQEKKKLFNNPINLPNLQGYEYYTGGIFNAGSVEETIGEEPASASAYPSQWDWRNRHSQNWVSPVKNQGSCGSCWAFSGVGSTEGIINVYYNQQLNIDIAEQDSVCRHPGSCANGGYVSWPLAELKTTGLVTEDCMPYVASDTVCNKCADQKPWKITNYVSIVSDDESLKRAIVEQGPITFGVRSWWHAITAVGWETDASGQTIWILKNSWGTGWGESGYVRMIVEQTDRSSNAYVVQPYYEPDPIQYQIACNDNDNDGYCNWGISDSKPNSCPAACSPYKDCDDSDPNLGGFDNNYHCIRVDGCEDTDTGKVYDVYGQIFGQSSDGITQDYCIDDFNLREVYCQYDIGYSEVYTCPELCRGGACVTPSCSDSDNGKVYGVAGSITGYMAFDEPKADYCIDEQNLYEVYCFNNLGYSEITICPSFCKDGACVELTPTTIDITSPLNEAIVTDKFLTITVAASPNTRLIDFYVNDAYKGSDSALPYKFKLNTQPYDGQTIVIKAVAVGDMNSYDEVTVKIGAEPEPSVPQCSDMKDNDRDKKCDWNGCAKNKIIIYPKDPNCEGPDDETE